MYGAVALDLLADEEGPLQVFGDTVYSGHRYRAVLTAAGHQMFCKPAPLKPAVPADSPWTTSASTPPPPR
ncbi:hypothetical protein [Streptomyces sp. Ac-502]|uniref:hypothetical protein n=1 Tax=Streptomyces sp. Ac-502 TaxID=3342801 RepID=UPI0038629B04